jgi:hypothetical protein
MRNVYYQVLDKNDKKLFISHFYSSKKFKKQSSAIQNLTYLKKQANFQLNEMSRAINVTLEQIEFVKNVILELDLCKIAQIEEICNVKIQTL